VAEPFQVTILSPEGVLWVGPAEQVIAPGIVGEFTVLPAHIPMISLLGKGSVWITLPKVAAPQTFDIMRGVCSVLPDEVVVLAHSELSLNKEYEGISL
jgi:F-type H+-transporting ATPase subunit epsilon